MKAASVLTFDILDSFSFCFQSNHLARWIYGPAGAFILCTDRALSPAYTFQLFFGALFLNACRLFLRCVLFERYAH